MVCGPRAKLKRAKEDMKKRFFISLLEREKKINFIVKNYFILKLNY